MFTKSNIHNNLIYNLFFNIHRGYSTLSNSSLEKELKPVLILSNLHDKASVNLYRELLKGKVGIYCFVNTVNNKIYIGSAKDLYIRLIEHLNNRKSNTALQDAFLKYGLDKFSFCIYEYFIYVNKDTSSKSLTNLETNYIKIFNFDTLYNFKPTATSSLSYKHSEEAILKMKK